MKKEENKTEKAILQAAEEEFMLKGFNGAKTTEIARKAGVTHAMLHYYYRTKENLFQQVFRGKTQEVADSLVYFLTENGTFEECLRNLVATHFDFLANNLQLIHLVYREVVSSTENRDMVLATLGDRVRVVIRQLDKKLKVEIALEHIKPIRTEDLLLNILSLNFASFVIYPIVNAVFVGESTLSKEVLEQRKASNIRFLLSGLGYNSNQKE